MDYLEEAEGEASSLRGQAEIWKHMFAFVDSLSLKCAIELRIPDVIHSNGGSITLSQLVSSINHDRSPSPPPPDTDCLNCIMRFLVSTNIFTAPAYDGVSHVVGDMFDIIPRANAVVLKWVLHDWNDESCVKILKNCRKAIPEKSGKVIILDVVLKHDGKSMFDEIGLAFDLVMMVNTTGGKERTELEWKKLFREGGFPRYKIIKIPALHSIIEAYLE